MSGNYVVVTLPNGKKSTVHKDNVDMARNQGWEIGPAAKTGSKSSINKAIRNDTAGSNYVDNGRNDGSVKLVNPSTGSVSSVNARYADKYFDKGYSLHDTSQSVNRALQSDYHAANDRANQAIRDGTYNPNTDYRDLSLPEYNNIQNNNINQEQGILEALNRYLGNLQENNNQNINNIISNLTNEVTSGNQNLLDELIKNLNVNNNDRYLEANNVNNSPVNSTIGEVTSINTLDHTNNRILPNNIYSGNIADARRNMSDDDYVKFMESILGF